MAYGKSSIHVLGFALLAIMIFFLFSSDVVRVFCLVLLWGDKFSGNFHKQSILSDFLTPGRFERL